jgi:nitrogenase-associated protein
MAHVIFYEKPGCTGNARQKALLLAAGHTLDVRDLLAHPWERAELHAFLKGAPVEEWFNRLSPRIKSGEVRPEDYEATEALSLLLQDHLLIRRPLLQVGQRREVGFLSAVVNDWIGLDPVDPPEPTACGGVEGCGSKGASGHAAGGVVQLGRGLRLVEPAEPG